MTFRVMIRDERGEEFTTKKGVKVVQRALHCSDMSVEGARFSPDIVIAMTPEQSAQWSGKVRDSYGVIEVADMEQFGKQFKVRDGRIVSVDIPKGR